jgi:Ser/Thr protein kinase RdoA (MazF antagonist)
VERAVRAFLAAAYGLSDVRLAIDERASSTLVRLESRDGVRWLRIATGVERTIDDAEEEARALAELARRGIRVAAAVPRADGSFAGTIDLGTSEAVAILYENAPGTTAQTLSLERARSLGSLLASIHAWGCEMPTVRRPPIDAERLVHAPLRELTPHFARHGLDIAPTRAIAEDMTARLAAHELPVSLCHGDVRLANVHFVKSVPTIFDFECCAMGPCAYDLACFWRQEVATDRTRGERMWKGVVSGYEKTRRLEPAELECIPVLATCRAIWVAALPARPGARWGREWLDDRSYFEAHASEIARFARSC